MEPHILQRADELLHEHTARHQKQTIIVSVPLLPPTVNHMYRSGGRGKRFLSEEAQTFRQEVALAARNHPAVPDGDLALTLVLTFGNRRKCDLDNRIKAAQDALALALGFDDQRVCRLVVERRREKGKPQTWMKLEEKTI